MCVCVCVCVCVKYCKLPVLNGHVLLILCVHAYLCVCACVLVCVLVQVEDTYKVSGVGCVVGGFLTQ